MLRRTAQIDPHPSDAEPLNTEKRKVDHDWQNLQGSPGGWNVQSKEFDPRRIQYTPRLGRVILCACWLAGTVDWDDVDEQIAPALPLPRQGEKDRRTSTWTKVRTKETQDETP